MKIAFERSHWSSSITLGIAIRWEDWHLRQAYLDIDFIVWSWRIVFDFGEVKHDKRRV